MMQRLRGPASGSIFSLPTDGAEADGAAAGNAHADGCGCWARVCTSGLWGGRVRAHRLEEQRVKDHQLKAFLLPGLDGQRVISAH